MAKPLTGVWTAIVTPFNEDGSIDLDSYESLVKEQEAAEVDGLVVFGTTGESPTLTVQEKLSLLKKTKALTGNNMGIMAGSGGNNTQQTVELSKLCVDAGADSLLIVTPPYNKPGLNGLQAHYGAVSDAVDVPITLYHVPGRTGSFLTAATMLEVLENPKIKAVKEASGDIGYFSKIAMNTSASLLSGDDFTYLPSLAVGGRGVVSVVTNIYPEAFVKMTKLFSEGQTSEAKIIHDALYPLTELLFHEPNPAPTKAALHIKGIIKDVLRLPLTKVTVETYTRVEAALNETDAKLKQILK
mgnify:CR=1 FL=1